MKIAIDLDDTLSVVDRVGLSEAYIARHSLPFRLVNPHAHRLQEVFDWTEADVMKFAHEHGGLTMFLEAKARKGARETLARWKRDGHEIIILTARQKSWFQNPEKMTRDWLEKRKIPYDKIVAEVDMGDKGAYCARNGISILVDDNVKACLGAQRVGVHAVLFLGKHNKEQAREVLYGGGSWTAIEAAVNRMIRILALEELSSRATPARQSNLYEGMELKFDDAPQKECNHVRAQYASVMELSGRIDLCEACYHFQNKPSRFRLTSLDAALCEELQRRGYRREESYQCYALKVIPPLSRPRRVQEVSHTLWQTCFTSVTGQDTLRDYGLIEGECVFLCEYVGATPVAVGTCVIEQNAVGIYDLFVKEEYRQNGFGARMLQALLVEGKRAGAQVAYLHFQKGNEGALALCRAFGFGGAYEYEYQREGQ